MKLLTLFLAIIFTSTFSYAGSIIHSESSANFTLPAYSAITLKNDKSNEQLKYDCKLYTFDDSAIVSFKSVKGISKLNAYVLSEGSQIDAKIPHGKEVLFVLDRLGSLELKNRMDYSIDIRCVV